MDIYTVYGMVYDIQEMGHFSVGKSFIDHESAVKYIKAEIEEIVTFLKGCYECNQVGEYSVESREYYKNSQTFGEYTISVSLKFDNDEHREFANLGKSLFYYHDWRSIEIINKGPLSQVSMYMLKLKIIKQSFE